MASSKLTEAYRQYAKRWEAVNAIEIEELRRLTPEERLRQFFALMELGKRMGWRTSTDEEIAMVRDRWNRLRKAYGV